VDVRAEIALLVLACGLVTVIPRVAPLALLRRVGYPKWLQEWLSFIPVTIMAALVAQELFPPGGDPAQSADELLAALACLACAVASRSLFLTVVIGIAALSLLQLL